MIEIVFTFSVGRSVRSSEIEAKFRFYYILIPTGEE